MTVLCQYTIGQEIKHLKTGNTYVIVTTPAKTPQKLEATAEWCYGYHRVDLPVSEENPIWYRSVSEIEDRERFVPILVHKPQLGHLRRRRKGNGNA